MLNSLKNGHEIRFFSKFGIQKLLVRKIVLILLLLLVSLPGLAKKRADHYFYYKAQPAANRGWIIMLPGMSGMSVFKDSTFYKQFADSMSKQGFDVILIDYKTFYKRSRIYDKPNGTPGEKIAWAVYRVLELAVQRNQIDTAASGRLMSWSLGGEGIAVLVDDQSFVNKYHIAQAASYYPPNIFNTKYRSKVPMIILTGASDNVTSAETLQKTAEGDELVKVFVYENSYHGFDIPSLTPRKYKRVPAFIGKKFIFEYNPKAAAESRAELRNFFLPA